MHKNIFRNVNNSTLLENEDKKRKKYESGENLRVKKWIYMRNYFPMILHINHNFQMTASETSDG